MRTPISGCRVHLWCIFIFYVRMVGQRSNAQIVIYVALMDSPWLKLTNGIYPCPGVPSNTLAREVVI